MPWIADTSLMAALEADVRRHRIRRTPPSRRALIDQRLESATEDAPGSESLAAAQGDHVFAVRQCFELTHAIDVDDHGSVNAHEVRGVEPPLHLRHRAAHDVYFGADVQPHVAIVRLDPVDFVRPEKDRSLPHLDGDPVGQSTIPRADDATPPSW